jgi:hypothetical protein
MDSSCKEIHLQALCGTKEQRTFLTTILAAVSTEKDRQQAEVKEFVQVEQLEIAFAH